MRLQSLLLISLLSFALLFTTACQNGSSSGTRAASVVPLEIRIGLVPFTQPTSTAELITGYIPQNQGKLDPTAMPELDLMLRGAVQKNQRTITVLPKPLTLTLADYHASATPQALAFWLNYGREYQMDFLLVPQILNWHQRQGSRAGVTKAAHVRAEFFLLDIRQQRIFRRSVYEVQQEGLVDNFLNMGEFFKRGAGWVTAEELTQEAITKAVKELGLE